MTTPNQPLDSATLSTPVGPWGIVVLDGVVVASGFAPAEEMAHRLAPDLRERGLRERRDLGSVTVAARAYLDGDLSALDAVAVSQPGGPFLQEVWRVMRQIPAGQTWTYAELATKAGRPTAVRAAGSGCARNLVAPFVPCHRVVRSDGTLGGYYYGLPAKEWLLAHEHIA